MGSVQTRLSRKLTTRTPFENCLIELTNFMEVREIQFKLQELLLNAVTESKLFKSVNDYIAWSQLTRIELDNLEQ